MAGRLTLFSIPKAFVGEAAVHQHNALVSWRSLDVDVALLGRERGVAEAAREFGAKHLPNVSVNEYGTPRVDETFALVDRTFGGGLRCFVNADIVLFRDLLEVAPLAVQPALLIGETLEVRIDGYVEAAQLSSLAADARREGMPRGAAASDYFIFPANLFGHIPPFAVGRAGFDNWLIWRARRVARVIDVSARVIAIHQLHEYQHLDGGKAQAYYGDEAARNIRLAGGQRHIFTRHDASHRLGPDGTVTRNLGSVFRSRETARKLAWKLGLR